MSDSFLSALKTGLAARVTARAGAAGAPPSLAATLTVAVSGTGLPAVAPHQVTLAGPGTVTGLDASLVTRTEPVAGSTGSEANLFPFIELAVPDLPWRFTPALPDRQGRLMPWLVLVVVKDDEGVSLAGTSGTSVLTISAAAGQRLPRLAEAHLWAHVQVTDASPQVRLARLICPIRLDAATAYIACLVPAFEAGRRAGLGLPVDDPSTAALAWNAQTEALDLPVYYSWRFRTGRDDFETLARRLFPAPADERLGLVTLDLSNPGSLLDAASLGVSSTPPPAVDFAGALMSPAAARQKWPDAHRTAFERAVTALLDAPIAPPSSSTAYVPLRDDPVVGPPRYGAWQSDADVAIQGWAREINTDPAWRAAAGLGARAVRREQEALMAEAWRQAGESRDTEAVLRRARVAIAVGGAVHRRLSALPADARLRITSRAHRAIVLPSTGRTIAHVLNTGSDTPKGAFDPALGRIAIRAGRVASLRVGTRASMLTRCSTAILEERVASSALVAIAPSPARSYDSTVTLASRGAAAPSREVSRDGIAGVAASSLAGQRFSKRVMRPVAPRAAAAPAGTLASIADALSGATRPIDLVSARTFARVRGVTARAFKGMPVPARPETAVSFARAGADLLARRAPGVLVPGIGGVPLNGVTLVRSNSEFIAAYLVGMNHEMSREFAWRGFPARLDGTWFRRFWDYTDERADIPPIGAWTRTASLASMATGARDDHAVVVLRAELLHRHPDVMVYAVPARWRPDKSSRTVDPQDFLNARPPIFTGRLGTGAAFFGFDLDPDTMVGSRNAALGKAGWFVVFEEHASAPRFGLDAAAAFTPKTAPATANALSWGHFAGTAAALAALAHAPSNPSWSAVPVEGAVWGRTSADMARLTWQRPVRVLLHADGLVR